MTDIGLYCPAGNFYIDPKRRVDHAVITHAHSDHARRGSKHYYCTTTGVALLQERLGSNIAVSHFPYQEKFTLGGVTISFHAAGHILGSSQVRIEFAGEVWVASGDYKLAPDATCLPFEHVKCDVFITEATFGTPAYTWETNVNLGQDMFDWWQRNAKQKMNSVIFGYSLGKAQRILNLLAPHADQPIYCNQATEKINACYREQNVVLAETRCLDSLDESISLEGELLVVPPGTLSKLPAARLGKKYKTAFASGWMAKSDRRFDRGFLISDHADWNDLLHAILQTEAKRIYVQHRGNGALIKELKSRGLRAFPDYALTPKNPAQLLLF